MRFGQEQPIVTRRDPTPAEVALWKRIIKNRDKGRKDLQRYLARADLLKLTNDWLSIRLPSYRSPLPNHIFASDMARCLNNWNAVETATAQVETGAWGVVPIFPKPGIMDFNIIIPEGKASPWPAGTYYSQPTAWEYDYKTLGVAWLIPVIELLGKVVVGAALAFVAYVTADVLTSDTDAAVALNQIDADMAKADPQVQADYAALRNSNPYKDKLGILAQLKEAAIGIGVAALIGFAIFAFAGMMKKRGSETAK